MHLRPRNPKRDRLVNEPLAAYSYFQIGVCPWGRGGVVQGCPAGPLADCGVSTRGFALFWILVSAFDPGCLSFSESLSAHGFCGPLGPSSVSGLVLLDLASGSLPPVFFGLSECVSVPASPCGLSLVSLLISLGVFSVCPLFVFLSVSMLLFLCVPDSVFPSLSPCVSLLLFQVPSSHLQASLTTSRPWPRRAGSLCCVWDCGRSGRTTTSKICRTAMARSG